MATEAIEVPARPVGRRFGLSDAMILMVGLALALASGNYVWGFLGETFVDLCRHVREGVSGVGWTNRTLRDAIRHDVRNLFWHGSQVALSLMFGLTPAWIVIRLGRPRPDRMTMLRQPGAVAALAMIFGAFWITGALVTFFPGRFDAWNALPSAMGGSVAVAWVVLAASGRRESEAGWVDRLGRLLGWTAIAMAMLPPLIYRI